MPWILVQGYQARERDDEGRTEQRGEYRNECESGPEFSSEAPCWHYSFDANDANVGYGSISDERRTSR